MIDEEINQKNPKNFKDLMNDNLNFLVEKNIKIKEK